MEVDVRTKLGEVRFRVPSSEGVHLHFPSAKGIKRIFLFITFLEITIMSLNKLLSVTKGLWPVSRMVKTTSPLVLRHTKDGYTSNRYILIDREFDRFLKPISATYRWVHSLEEATSFHSVEKLEKVMTTLTEEHDLDFYYRERGKAGYSMKPSSTSDEYIELDVCVVNHWINRFGEVRFQESVITV